MAQVVVGSDSELERTMCMGELGEWVVVFVMLVVVDWVVSGGVSWY